MTSYCRPATLAETVSLLAADGPRTTLLAGGTDALVALRDGELRDRMLLDLKSVGDLPRTVTRSGDEVSIGAGAVLADLEADDTLRAQFPALVEAIAQIGSIQIRNRATLAGNICHASPAADSAPPLLAYRSQVELTSADGSRRIPISEFFLAPRRTVCRATELVTSVVLPLPAPGTGSAFGRLTRRRGVDLATLSVACVIGPESGVTFALGAVGPTPLVSVFEGARDDKAGLDEEMLRRLLAIATPISDVRAGADYRAAMVTVLARRTFQAARARRNRSVES